MDLLNVLQMVILIPTYYNWYYNSNCLVRQELGLKRSSLRRKAWVIGSEIIQTDDNFFPKVQDTLKQTFKSLFWDLVGKIEDSGPKGGPYH